MEVGRSFKFWVVVSLLLSLPSGEGFLSGGGFTPREGSSLNVSFEEKLLATIPEEGIGLPSDFFVFSPDGRKVAFIVHKEDREAIVINGEVGPEFENVEHPCFSPDGRRFIYKAREDGKEFVIIDGKKGEKFDRVDVPIFSPDGRRIAYIAGKDFLWIKKCMWVVDGEKGKKFDMLGLILFSWDGKKFVYHARKGRKEYIVVNGNKVEKFDRVICCLTLSPDGKRLAYFTTGKDGKQFVVIDGKKGEKFDGVDFITFSPDGKRIAYRAREGDKHFMVIDGKKGEVFDEVGRPIFSPDGKRIAYVAGEVVGGSKVDKESGPGMGGAPLGMGIPMMGPGMMGGREERRKYFMVIDGKKGEKFDEVGKPVFSPDGKRIAYRVREGDKWFIIVDGKKGEKFDKVGDPVFSPDGRRIAYVAWESGKGLRYNTIGVLVGSMSGVPKPGMERGKYFVVIDGNKKKIEAFDWVGRPVFSPDGKKVAFGARKGRELWWKVIKVE